MAIRPELLQQINYFQQRPWALLNVMGEILAHNPTLDPKQPSLKAIQQYVSSGNAKAVYWDQGWYLHRLPEQGHSYLAVLDSQTTAALAVEVLLQSHGANQRPEPIAQLAPLEAFQALIGDQLSWTPAYQQQLVDFFGKKHGDLQLMLLEAPQLKAEALISMFEALDHKVLYALYPKDSPASTGDSGYNGYSGYSVVVTPVAVHEEIASILHLWIQEELMTAVRMVEQVPITSFRGIRELLEALQGALKISYAIKPQQDRHPYRSVSFALAIYQGLKIQSPQLPPTVDASGILNDPELLNTIQVFFKHSLNVTDTANALYVHRNTLLYRLQKITQLTGLDLKHFEDAVNLYVILAFHGGRVPLSR